MAKALTEARANDMMNVGYHCSQAVAEHIAERFGLDREFYLRMTAGLGAGCNHGDTCGAISAAIMGLGIAMGFDRENDPDGDGHFDPLELETFLRLCVRQEDERKKENQ